MLTNGGTVIILARTLAALIGSSIVLLAIGIWSADAQHMPQIQSEHPPFTFRAPTLYGPVNQGTALTIVPQTESYRLNGPIRVQLWFQTKHPQTDYFFPSRGGLQYIVIAPSGQRQPMAMTVGRERRDEWRVYRPVGISNGPTFDDDLSTLFRFTVPGTYRISAGITLADRKGVTINSPVVSIVINE